MTTLHQRRTHPTPIAGCFGCHVGTLRFAFEGKVGEIDKQRAWDKELDEYRSAVAQGIEPDTTKTADIRRAVRWSENHGVAYSEEKAHEVRVDQALEKVA